METEIYYITDTSDLDILSISPDIVEESVVANNLIPQKSKKVYEKLFEKFMEWRVRKNVTSFSENALLIYFEEMSKTMKSSTLWTHYSVLKTTLIVKHGIDISKYRKLYSLLKQKSIGYSGKKANIFSTNEIKTFIDEAPDDTYLLIKVALIFGIMGACRRHELHKLKFDDVKDLESTILVTIPNTNTNTSRAFTVTGKYYNICKKYMNLRPKKCESTSFFVNYYGGKCSVQNVGINKFGNMGKEIATYLKLPDPLSYTGHCFRRSSTTVFSGGDVTTLIRHGRSTTSGSKNNVQSPKETRTQTEREVDLTLSEDETLESANCMLDNLSSEDSSHSELHSGDPLAFIDMASSSLDKGCKSGPSSITFDLPESTVSKNVVLATLSTKNSGTQLPQEPDFPEGTLSTIPTMSNHHSSHSPQQRTPLNKRPNVEIENIQFNFDDTSLETSQIDASLKRLEDISNKVNHESILNDNFDDFGRYVVSLLRSIPAQRAKELQQEIIDLILKSDSNPSVSLDMLRQESSTLPDKESQKRTSPMNVDSPIAQATSASSSESSVPSTSTQAVEMPVLASSRLTPQDSSLIAQKVSVNEPMLQQNSKGDKRPPPSVDTASTTQNVKLSLHGQNERRNKRPLADGDISCEVTNKQSKLDNMLLKANRLDAALKRLEELVLVSNKVTLLSGKNDHFDIFGTYVSSLLKYFPLQKGMELQRQIINLILRVHVDVDT